MRATPAVFFPSGEKMVICKLSCRHFLCFPPLTDWLTDSMCCCGPVYALVDGFILQHTGLYPIVSKGMRLIAQGKDPLEGQRHMCGMGNMFNYHSTGFPELDELMRTPQSLIFIMELLQVCFTFISFLENILFWKLFSFSPNYVRSSFLTYFLRVTKKTVSGRQNKLGIPAEVNSSMLTFLPPKLFSATCSFSCVSGSGVVDYSLCFCALPFASLRWETRCPTKESRGWWKRTRSCRRCRSSTCRAIC